MRRQADRDHKGTLESCIGRYWVQFVCKSCRIITNDPADLMDRYGNLTFEQLQDRLICSKCRKRDINIVFDAGRVGPNGAILRKRKGMR